MFSALLPRSSSGQDAALSRLKQEFDSPTGRHIRTRERTAGGFFPSPCDVALSRVTFEPVGRISLSFTVTPEKYEGVFR